MWKLDEYIGKGSIVVESRQQVFLVLKTAGGEGAFTLKLHPAIALEAGAIILRSTHAGVFSCGTLF